MTSGGLESLPAVTSGGHTEFICCD